MTIIVLFAASVVSFLLLLSICPLSTLSFAGHELVVPGKVGGSEHRTKIPLWKSS